MAYDELLEQRVREFFDAKRIKHESKRMMGGLCFMVNGKMCVGVEKNRLMPRIFWMSSDSTDSISLRTNASAERGGSLERHSFNAAMNSFS